MSAKSRSFIVLVFALLTLIVGLSAIHAQNDTAANKATAAQFFALATDASKSNEVKSLLADNFVAHTAMGEMGWDFMQGGMMMMLNAMPDVKYTPLIFVADGANVAVRYAFSGTFTNPLPSFDGTSVMQPTGQPILLYSNAILTFNAEGKITEYIEMFDNLEFGIQLGQAPAEMRMTPPISEPDAATWTVEPTTPEFSAQIKASLLAANPAAYNEGHVDALDALYASDYVSYPSMTDLAANKAMILSLRAAMPDLHTEGVLVLAEGNWVVYHWTLTGTFTNALNMNGLQVQATQKPVAYDGIVIAKVNADGKIVADWNEIDNVAIATQYGLMGQ